MRLAAPIFTIALGLSGLRAGDDFPIVPDDLEVRVFAKDPLVRNPCALAFDARGRLCVGMGPQYRNPTPQTPGDSVFILVDTDRDGEADQRIEFATGLNAIQGLAWQGDRLYIANAPDLTVARDIDGDDQADEYVRLYTDLGNLEHGLHGLNFAPDGKLYMSKGNSKGLDQAPGRIAPEPFRELWGMPSRSGNAFPKPVTFGRENYQRNYHDPRDDWGLCGGVLRCDPDGSQLEIISRGCRNPWDIAFDSRFDWLGTDNDQTHGDKFIAPFFGAHFGWGHPWSFDWEGENHLPSAPSAGPLFEGSGTGVIYCAVEGYPEKYRDVFLVNDWLRREVYIYRATWDGARMRPSAPQFDLLAHAGGGRTMQQSLGRRFDPVDIEIGPEGAIYISSWGRQYGTVMENGRMANEGRIYKIWPKGYRPAGADPKHRRSIREWTTEQLIHDLGHHLPAWRTNAQEELVRRGEPIAVPREPTSIQEQTWALWANGRMAAASRFPTSAGTPFNIRLQSLRILAIRREQSAAIAACLTDDNPRIRHAAVIALHQSEARSAAPAITDLAATESDRLVFYSVWQALRALVPARERKRLLEDSRPGVRRAALLSLLEDDALPIDEINAASKDPDPLVASLAMRRLGGKAETVIKGGPLVKPATRQGKGQKPLLVVDAIQPVRDGRYEQASLELGALAYTDRSYRFREVPTSLRGSTFIRAANDDADPHTGTGFSLDLRYPSTVYLADDSRGERLPLWARGRFGRTDLTLATGDARYTLHKADFPAGRARFGPNREGVRGRKAHYILIPQPKLPIPPEKPTTVADVMPLIARADIEHGRNLFFQARGATCYHCHRLEGRGNVFAPDLAGIGTRADAAFVVRSILEPSAAITEGFTTQIITKKDGSSIGGIVLEESGHSLKISPGGGQVTTIERADIAKRESIETSAMPAVFHAMLRPEDVAALTAYLLRAPAKEVAADATYGTSPGFQITRRSDRLEISFNDKPVANYFFRHEKVWRPFLANVRTPGGTVVTRTYPPAAADPQDHPDMHPGISLGFANLNGVNFWHNREGRVRHVEFTEIRANHEEAFFMASNRYVDRGGDELCSEIASFRFTHNEDGFLITFESRITSGRHLDFGVKEEMGLAVRLATPITVKFGEGSILGAAGGKNERGTWGKIDRWWDYSGPVGDRNAGIQIMSAPSNPDIWSHSRDYGVLVANPFPIDIAKNRGKKTGLAPGDELRLTFGLQIHEHLIGNGHDPKVSYRRFLDAIGR